jgi:hypothetical protein
MYRKNGDAITATNSFARTMRLVPRQHPTNGASYELSG